MGQKPPSPDLSGLTHEEKDSLILTLLARLVALESKVNKANHNSSKPPSSDGLTKKTRSLRESSGKPPGGQAGHKGTTLKQVALATQTIDHPFPWQCDRCQHTLSLHDAQVAKRRQVVEVLMTAYDVLEHRPLTLACRCGQVHMSVFTTGVTEAAQIRPERTGFCGPSDPRTNAAVCSSHRTDPRCV